MKFTQDGVVVIRAKFLPMPAPAAPVQLSQQVYGGEVEKKRMLRVEVEDSGEGIAQDRLQVLFEAFTQADTSTSRKHGACCCGGCCTGVVWLEGTYM